ncbi:DUF167 domain-containing protein [Thermosyntropha sp.]|uniref:DUF167 domain-containing protein n=1 Tax=Thermosyntropha sp. TaxID=2740820 RepID=UPI0025DA950F|nr:DUF167 domain-containing protein [Thermosyntropha sp.]MBO8158575.1 YggU family protein [Thermosyntropha sp.]
MIEIVNTDDGVRFNVKVIPRSSRNQIVGDEAGILKIKLNAPPVEGEANKALISFLADVLRIAKSNVLILKGENSRRKVIEVRGINEQYFREKIKC